MNKSLLLLSSALFCAFTANADMAQKTTRGYELGSSVWTDFENLTAAANEGDAKAMYVLAWAYDEGAGVKEDDATARTWYKKSVEGLTKLANDGDIDAMLALGDLYEEGDGVREDEKKAAEWYQKAADADSAEGLYQLAECYEDGDGVPRDRAKAIELYKAAIAKGHKKAQKELNELERGDD